MKRSSEIQSRRQTNNCLNIKQKSLVVLLWISSAFVIFYTGRYSKTKGLSETQGARQTNSCLNIKKLLFDHRNPYNVTHLLLITQMRSGSTFTARILSTAPSVFYTEEPLREYLGHNVTSKDQKDRALDLLRDILLCQFSSRSDYYAKRMSGQHDHNVDTLRLCSVSEDLCRDSSTDEALCGAASIRLVRLVSFYLEDLIPLLDDPDLSIWVLHLVRDPRGLLNSRRNLKGLHHIFDIETNAKLVCDRYHMDMKAARFINANYAKRYALLRYEDLSRRPQDTARALFAFLKVPYSATVQDKVGMYSLGVFPRDKHPFGVHRNSSSAAFKWRDEMEFPVIRIIQDECLEVFGAYGYGMVRSREELRDKNVEILLSPQKDFLDNLI